MSLYYQIKNTKFKAIVNTILQEFKESSNMRYEKWLQRGIEELKQNHWFDGYQMILGAYQRVLQSDSPAGWQGVYKGKVLVLHLLSSSRSKSITTMTNLAA